MKIPWKKFSCKVIERKKLPKNNSTKTLLTANDLPLKKDIQSCRKAKSIIKKISKKIFYYSPH
jgi:hypothetical protein